MSDMDSLEEQAAQEGYVPDPPEYSADEDPGDDFPIGDFVEVGPSEESREWTVIDSEGFYHTVKAHHIGHSMKGYITFWTNERPVNDMIAAFHEPVGVYPKEKDDGEE